MNLTEMTIEEMCTTTEKQLFDRKSAKIDAAAVAILMIAFANADGGLLAVGIEDDGEITGIDDYTSKINEILRAGYDFCQPSIFIEKEVVECTDSKGNQNHILLIKIPQSNDMHVNNRDEAYMRVGDKSKKLTFEERMALMYSKGIRFYENEPVYGSTLDDIDMEFVAEYCKKISYGKTPEEYIKQNKDYIVNVAGRSEMSGAAILMFGKQPQRFFPRSRVRFIRYEGNDAKVGTEMNVIKDICFEGRILELVEKTLEYVKTQIKEHTYLGSDARFVTEPEYRAVAFMVHATIKNKKFLQDSKITKGINVAQDVAQDVAQGLASIIISEMQKNNKVTREQIAKLAHVSTKTVEREIKKMGNVHYEGRGANGHWKID